MQKSSIAYVALLLLTEEILVPGHHHKFTVDARIRIASDKKANQT